jgi:YD repeat-containing protein
MSLLVLVNLGSRNMSSFSKELISWVPEAKDGSSVQGTRAFTSVVRRRVPARRCERCDLSRSTSCVSGERRSANVMAWRRIKLAICLAFFLCAPLITYAGSATVHDALDRVTESHQGNGFSFSYTYDAAGNRLSRTITVPSPAEIVVEDPSTTPPTSLADGAAALSFPATDISQGATRTLTVRNSGQLPTHLRPRV